MTKNQIEYWKNQEQIRHDQATEQEQARANRANEAIKSQTNTNTLQLGLGNLQELSRHNYVVEGEANRSNLANEEIKRVTNDINAYNAATNARNADTNARNAATNAVNAQTAISNLAEVARHDRISEAIDAQELQETKRHQRAQDSQANLNSAINAGKAGNQANVDYARQDELVRHDVVTENETKRNNLINQQLKSAELLEKINNDKFTTMANLVGNMKPNVSYRIGGR